MFKPLHSSEFLRQSKWEVGDPLVFPGPAMGDDIA